MDVSFILAQTKLFKVIVVNLTCRPVNGGLLDISLQFYSRKINKN